MCGSLKGMPVDRVCGVCAPPIGGTPLTQAVPRFPSRALRWVDVERGALFGADAVRLVIADYPCPDGPTVTLWDRTRWAYLLGPP